MPIRMQDKLSNIRLNLRYRFDHYLPDGWSPAPTRVQIIPTYRCNLRCKMCYQRNDEGRPRVDVGCGELTPRQWKPIIEQLVGFSAAVQWYGGELFVYPDIMELLSHSCAVGLDVSLSTNGFSLAKHAEQLVEIGVKSVVVSLDGPDSVHNDIRRHPKSYERAIRGIQAVLAARQAKQSCFPQVLLSYTITRQNYRYVSEFYALAKDLGVDEVNFIGLIYLSPDTALSHNAIMQTEFDRQSDGMQVLYNEDTSAIDGSTLQREVNQLLAEAPASPAVRFWARGLENNLEAHYGPDEAYPLARLRCFSIWQNLVIHPNGAVVVCPFYPEMVVGNVLEQNLRTIWNNNAFKKFRKRVRTQLLPGCLRCPYSQYIG